MHMSQSEIDTYDTLQDADYVYGELSDDGMWFSRSLIHYLPFLELEIPPSMVPPSTDDTDSKRSRKLNIPYLTIW